MNRTQVQYQTPVGTVNTPEEAEAICARLDMDYNLVVKVIITDGN